ncbi:MAG: Trm112 family protein [Desulfovibrionales bacterium]|nr:MAG: Trm112 family protein [Desulfovibrionales bacterium]
MPLNKELLSILACPKCKADVTLTPAEDGLICHPCAVVYPIREEIPIMLIEEAIPMQDWEKGVREQAKGAQ